MKSFSSIRAYAFLIGIVFLGAVPFLEAFAAPIISGNDTASFVNSDYGVINLTPSLGSGIDITASGITGHAWGDRAGWISFDCSSGSNCGLNGNYGVSLTCDATTGDGILSGYAWGENTGWISFNCTNGSNCGSNGNHGVIIDQNGQFDGFAWSENFGWLSFDASTCPSGSSCVETTFTCPFTGTPPLSSGSSRPRSGGSVVSTRRTTIASDQSQETSSEAVAADSPADVCDAYLNDFIREGSTNNPDDVRKLQRYLNEREDEALEITGTYDETTVAAAKRYQEKYAQAILAPWGLTEGSGYVYKTTLAHINARYCGETRAKACPYFTEYHEPGSVGEDVIRIQDFLRNRDLYQGVSTGVYDPTTIAGVQAFQEQFREFILEPWGIVEPTKYWYKTTRKYGNWLVGCVEISVELEGVGTYDF